MAACQNPETLQVEIQHGARSDYRLRPKMFSYKMLLVHIHIRIITKNQKGTDWRMFSEGVLVYATCDNLF